MMRGVYLANLAFAATLIAATAGTALSHWAAESQTSCGRCAKWMGRAVTVLALLAALCTLYHSVKDCCFVNEQSPHHGMMMPMGDEGGMMPMGPGGGFSPGMKHPPMRQGNPPPPPTGSRPAIQHPEGSTPRPDDTGSE